MSKIGTETLCHIGSVLRRVKCIRITGEHHLHNTDEEYLLHQNFTTQEYNEFFSSLDELKYNSGFGSQYFSGIIWFEDGTWSERREYDGSEWWSHCVCPSLPESLQAAGDK